MMERKTRDCGLSHIRRKLSTRQIQSRTNYCGVCVSIFSDEYKIYKNNKINSLCKMSKFMLFALVVLMASTLISAASKDKCGRHGDPCISGADCCPLKQMACNRFAKRCQIQITVDELMAQREKILGRKGPDMK